MRRLKRDRLLHSILSRNGQALHVIFARLKREVSRIRNASEKPNGLGRVSRASLCRPLGILTSLQITLFHNLVISSNDLEYWTPDRLIQAVVGIWFAASHQPWIVGRQNLVYLSLEYC